MLTRQGSVQTLDNPIFGVSLMPCNTFGFIEFATEELATTVVQFDRIEFMGRPMKLGRPGKIAHQTVFTPGIDVTPLREKGIIPSPWAQSQWKAGGTQHGVNNQVAKMEQKKREIYVSGFPPNIQVTPQILKDMFAPCCEYLPSYNKALGFPVLGVSIVGDGKFAFVEFQTQQLAEAVIPCFSNIEYLGHVLIVNKPAMQPGVPGYTA
jgi:RNA recognition motif-containing protein